MIIRTATREDVPEVKKILDSVQVSRNQEGWQNADNGFFEYLKSEQEFISCLNPYFSVAQTKRGIRGYALAYDSGFFREKFADSKCPECRFVLDNVEGTFIYVD